MKEQARLVTFSCSQPKSGRHVPQPRVCGVLGCYVRFWLGGVSSLSRLVTRYEMIALRCCLNCVSDRTSWRGPWRVLRDEDPLTIDLHFGKITKFCLHHQSVWSRLGSTQSGCNGCQSVLEAFRGDWSHLGLGFFSYEQQLPQFQQANLVLIQ